MPSNLPWDLDSNGHGNNNNNATGIPLTRASGLALIHDTPKGRGVFASQPVRKGTVIEVCPVLILPHAEVREHITKTSLDHYTYNWPFRDNRGKVSTTQAIVLGLGSMFNHSTLQQNVAWKRDVEGQVVVYTALRDIQRGEELCISYGGGLWFEDVDASEAEEEHVGGEENGVVEELNRIDP